ncbi:putative Glycogenin-1 [Glarea lozoyensis 74030]|uniref:Putative Glycogenin-1 n=1 Tax=Glarea lozoyensis (strain ATCC 74030 / MF5533) TaxID=1104152 RepID=H0ETK9_GLAL7|nr:putative Glycogenin-1 [Glarea lozoyensis 74030]
MASEKEDVYATTVFDFIIPVERIVNQSQANLFLMNRADLHSTFTKLNLWKLVQFRKIVYVDADMVSIRAPDELFDLPHAFSAAPDIGWPDIFNTQEHTEKEKEREIPYNAWDARTAPPPSDSRPEAHNFPSTHYEMSSDTKPFQAPQRYPDPPKDMWYEVPKAPSYQKPAPIFPWEQNAPKPTRVFPEDNLETTKPDNSVEFAPEPAGSGNESSTPVTPSTPTIQLTPADPWQTYSRGNAWDDIPEIERDTAQV